MNGNMNGNCHHEDNLDVLKLPRAQNYIYGEFENTDTYIDSYEPSTGKVWALIPNSTGKEYTQIRRVLIIFLLCVKKFYFQKIPCTNRALLYF